MQAEGKVSCEQGRCIDNLHVGLTMMKCPVIGKDAEEQNSCQPCLFAERLAKLWQGRQASTYSPVYSSPRIGQRQTAEVISASPGTLSAAVVAKGETRAKVER